MSADTALIPAFDRAAERRWAAWLALWLLGFGLLTRGAGFGDLAYFNDETFYWVAALRLHDGAHHAWALPYVDVWDRKGPGLFLTYWLMSGVSRSVLAFQIGGWLAASATAWLMGLTARRMVGTAGAVGAATLYLACLPMFGGGGGQSPVFYNLPVMAAVWLIWRRDADLLAGRCPRGVIAAMGLAGFALTFKQTVAPEAAFLGIWVLGRMAAGGVAWPLLARRAVLLAAAGCAPFALFGLAYVAAGHFDLFWHAMVTSNLTKTYNPAHDHWTRIQALAISGAPAFALAVVGAGLALWRAPRAQAWFAVGWLMAGLVGFVIVPNFYHHYVLPLLLPVALAAGYAMRGRPYGMVAGGVAVWIMVVASPALDRDRVEASRNVLNGLAARIAARDPAPRLLVYEGPMALYGLVGAPPPSPLLDNFHLYFPPENNTSPWDTGAEMARILAWRPSVVVTYHDWPAAEENPRTASQVRAYVGACRHWGTYHYAEAVQSFAIDVWGDCPR
ncbi:hypothetical protein GTZ99_03250 [Novosphingobium sp. FSY-8]|uniref:Glycosyltransferase RgtA/B/C/D-like domain-containing protein n=1 Tax=Novosphingobium ovatum TaxID=1908523 RepID=A0ABW9XAK8_9SPHN|nr:hypothetical protein [Novosphingobium ovatum]NBC35569.1 hypothetical protein [Novosphingobium ovatum]